MGMFDVPWSVPVLAGHTYRIGFGPAAAVKPPTLEDDPAVATFRNVVTVREPQPEPEPARVGRPDRGNRSKVKAARRQRRTSH